MIPVWLTDTVTPDLGRALHYTQLWGLQGVELRTVGGPDDRVPDVNEPQIRQQLEASEFLLSSVAPALFGGPVHDRMMWLNDLARLPEILSFCQRMRCPRFVIDPFAATPNDADTALDTAADALRQAGEKAAAKNVIVGVKNDPSSLCPTGQDLALLLALVDHANVQAVWDPAAAFRAGEDPHSGLDALAGRITMVRCSDGRIEQGQWQDAVFGKGDINWTAQIEMLADFGFRGPISLEVYAEPRPKAGLRSATALIRLLERVQRAG
jgi:sugar phosphate isomerase/epimerase